MASLVLGPEGEAHGGRGMRGVPEIAIHLVPVRRWRQEQRRRRALVLAGAA